MSNAEHKTMNITKHSKEDVRAMTTIIRKQLQTVEMELIGSGEPNWHKVRNMLHLIEDNSAQAQGIVSNALHRS